MTSVFALQMPIVMLSSALCGVHVVLCAHDLADRRLPNHYVALAWILVGMTTYFEPSASGVEQLTSILAGCVASLALMQWSFTSRGAIGMGDAKLFGSLCVLPTLSGELMLWSLVLIAALGVHAVVQCLQRAATCPLAPTFVIAYWTTWVL